MAPVESPPGNSNSDAWLKGKASPSSLPKGFAPDPCRILEPSKKNLQMLESQRIMAVLEDTIHRIELVTLLEQIIAGIPRFGVALGSDLVELLSMHGMRMEKYEFVLNALKKEEERLACYGPPKVVFTTSSDSERDDSPVSPDIPVRSSRRWESLKKDTDIAEQGLKFSLMDILRHFKKNPEAVQVILGSRFPKSQEHNHLLDYMGLLHGVMKERLLTSPTEEIDRKRYIVDILMRERKTNAAKERLQARYKEAVRDKEHEVTTRNITITQLKSDLALIDKVTHDQQHKTLSDAAKQCSTETKSSESRKATMRDDMITMRKTTRESRRVNRGEETVMRKRAFKIGTEVFNWVQKYDADMGARQDEYDRIQKLYEEDKQDLKEMQAEFEKMEAKYNAILEERRLAAEAEKRRQEEIVFRNIAAVRIQSLWRGHRVRKALKGGKKGGKKGKKGKK